MTAQLIDGNALPSRSRRASPRAPPRCRARPAPGLAVILVGDDPASAGLRAQQGQGLRGGRHALGARALPGRRSREAELLARIAALNADPAVHGILVQMPLPQHIDPQKVIEAIAPAKDVDGFSVAERRRAARRPARLPAVHAVRLHEADREHRHRPARQARRRHRPQQHRRQADGAAAAAGQRHRHRLPQRARPTSAAHTRQRRHRRRRGRPRATR